MRKRKKNSPQQDENVININAATQCIHVMPKGGGGRGSVDMCCLMKIENHKNQRTRTREPQEPNNHS